MTAQHKCETVASKSLSTYTQAFVSNVRVFSAGLASRRNNAVAATHSDGRGFISQLVDNLARCSVEKQQVSTRLCTASPNAPSAQLSRNSMATHSPPKMSPSPSSPRLLQSQGMLGVDADATRFESWVNATAMMGSLFLIHVIMFINTLVDPPTERIVRKTWGAFCSARKRSKFLMLLMAFSFISLLVALCWRLVNFLVFIVFPGYIIKHVMLFFIRQLRTGTSGAQDGIKRVLLVNDCNDTQVCGVLRKFYAMQKHLTEEGYEVHTIQTDQLQSCMKFWMPFFPEVKCCVYTPYLQYTISREIERFNPDAINILTEGTLGVATRMHCRVMNRKFSTMFCTRYDVGCEISCAAMVEQKKHFKTVGKAFTWFLGYITRMYVRWFHSQSMATITPSPTMGRILEAQELAPNIQPIFNGCDTSSFSPDGELCPEMKDLPRPIWLSVGRLCKSKNVGSLLDIAHELPGTVVFVGKGPYFDGAVEAYAGDKIKFLGWKTGDALAACYRTADVFVFTSKLDTFGQVMVEAMASGLCVAGLPVPGPIDVVKDGVTGALDDDLLTACRQALASKNLDACVSHARTFSWPHMCRQFIKLHRTIQILPEFTKMDEIKNSFPPVPLSDKSSHRKIFVTDCGFTIAMWVTIVAVGLSAAGMSIFSDYTLSMPLLYTKA